MIKKAFIGFLLLFLIASCMICVPGAAVSEAIHPILQTPEVTVEATTPTSPTALIDSKLPVTLEQGKAMIITLTDEEQARLSKWSSGDASTVTVDSGGRIDGIKPGTAVITAHYTDNSKSECTVTVVEAEAQSVDRYSTAYTANSDILNKNIKSDSDLNPYKITVNRSQNCVTVYTYDENGRYSVPVRAMICSCGKNNATVTGSYTLYFKSEWLGLLNNVYGHYVSGIHGDYLFHSVPYYTKNADDLETHEYNKLGDFASLGCVRMATSDVKWIYEHCPRDTEIEIYDDDEPGPLGKPEAIRITDHTCGWDPTDDNGNNPYNDKAPVISGAADISLAAGEGAELLSKVTAVDTCGNDITDKLEILENVDFDRPGVYKVTYSVTDVLHRSDKTDITVTISE